MHLGSPARAVRAQFILKFLFQTWDEGSSDTIPSPLDAHAVHVYSGPLNPQSPHVDALRECLSEDERERAARFHFEKNRNEYILSRGSLRQFLAAYLKIPPQEVRFGYTRHSKPFLADASQRVTFNISHTDGLVAFAFTLNHAVGIDVEAVRSNIKTEQIAERFFSVAERQALRDCAPEQRHPAFYRCWTRKEAYIKARGEGLSHPLAQFDVALDEHPERVLLATRPDPAEIKRWLMQPFTVPQGYAAAVAVSLEPIDYCRKN
jgi:4'-phosphopantetheinyl transferase